MQHLHGLCSPSVAGRSPPAAWLSLHYTPFAGKRPVTRGLNGPVARWCGLQNCLTYLPCCAAQPVLLRSVHKNKGNGNVRFVTSLCLITMLTMGTAGAADIGGRLDGAKALYQKGEIAKSTHELEAVLMELQDRLGRSLEALMPAPLPGWHSDEAEYEALLNSGGGLSVSRAYAKGDASLNASIILDNPAVDAALEPQPAQQSVKKIKVGNDDAVLRWDAASHSGDLTLVLGRRVLVQIEGEELASSDPLTDLAKALDLAALRRVTGVN